MIVLFGGGDGPAHNFSRLFEDTDRIDKLNQYARGGEIAALSYATKWGVLPHRNWFEETNTLRYQIYTDPLTWVDSSFYLEH